LHKENADKGFVVLTVSVDDEQEWIDEANTFLRKSANAPLFRHLHLTTPKEEWQAKLDFKLAPCYYVFDRQGKWVRFRGSDYKKGVPYDEMDKVVLKMLAEK
jgi:hypothetical protein